MNSAVAIRAGRWLILSFSLSVGAGCAIGAGSQYSPNAPAPSMVIDADSGMKGSALAGTPVTQKALIIRNGGLDLSTEDVLAVKPKIEQITAAAGGRVESSSLSDDADLSVTLRVPEPQLDQVMKQISALGKVKSSHVNSQDVTGQVFDLRARLNSQRALRDRLLFYLKNRDAKLDEILKVEREIARVQAEIEIMEARLKHLEGLVTMSTLNVTVSKKTGWW